jgi:hypothetical protein
MEKKSTVEYETPRIEDHGNLEELTAGTNKAKLVATPDGSVPYSTP